MSITIIWQIKLCWQALRKYTCHLFLQLHTLTNPTNNKPEWNSCLDKHDLPFQWPIIHNYQLFFYILIADYLIRTSLCDKIINSVYRFVNNAVDQTKLSARTNLQTYSISSRVVPVLSYQIAVIGKLFFCIYSQKCVQNDPKPSTPSQFLIRLNFCASIYGTYLTDWGYVTFHCFVAIRRSTTASRCCLCTIVALTSGENSGWVSTRRETPPGGWGFYKKWQTSVVHDCISTGNYGEVRARRNRWTHRLISATEPA